MRILIINGPNLNMLGKREPEIYGSRSFEDYYLELTERFKGAVDFDYFQSNSEGALIDAVQNADGNFDGVILNAGGYTHTSVALADAIASVRVAVCEVHISSIMARESFRHTSLIAPVCCGTIMGFGLDSYRLAAESFLK